jgi:ankyrin repeat protein
MSTAQSMTPNTLAHQRTHSNTEEKSSADRPSSFSTRTPKNREPYNKALLDAAASLNVAGVKQAIKDGAYLDARCEINNKAALHLAVLTSNKNHDEEKVIELLLKSKACPNVCDSFGRTPLHHAAGIGADTCVQLLLTHNANPLLHDKQGKTPYDVIACRKNESFYKPTIHLLKQAQKKHQEGCSCC